MGMGFELVGLVLASVYFGGMIDEKFNLGGLGLVGLCMMSLIGWMIHLIQLAKQVEKQKQQ